MLDNGKELQRSEIPVVTDLCISKGIGNNPRFDKKEDTS